MRKNRRAVALLALLVAACSRGPSATPPPASAGDPARPLPSPLPEVVARVNGQAIRIQQILPMAKGELDRVSVAERDKKKPEVLRSALRQYVDRELLLQEAIARGVRADSREVDWAYDQMRREYADDQAWNEFLAGQGMDTQSLKAELRARHTVDALIDREAADRPGERREVQAELLARLRARARIELYL